MVLDRLSLVSPLSHRTVKLDFQAVDVWPLKLERQKATRIQRYSMRKNPGEAAAEAVATGERVT